MKNKKKVIFLVGVLLIFCGYFIYVFFFKKEDVSFKIDESLISLKREIPTNLKSPYKMSYIIKGYFNDTIIINNEKVPPSEIKMNGNSDYYGGSPPIIFSYKKYKATEIKLSVCYVFFGL